MTNELLELKELVHQLQADKDLLIEQAEASTSQSVPGHFI